MLTAPGTNILTSSFRDPNGFLFRRGGVLYRQVNTPSREHYDLLMKSGLYAELTAANLLIPHDEVPEQPAVPGVAYVVIKPEVVDFVSYPYEWCFEQLKDAALTTLEVQKRAIDKGMSLRDASAYNIQFHRGRAVLIDTLSFERLPEGKPWIAYKQFCQHFLAPLAVMSYRDVRLGQLLRSNIDGLPLDLAVRLLPFRARTRIPLLLHLFVHSRSQDRYARKQQVAASRINEKSFSLQAFKGLLDSLTRGIDKLKIDGSSSSWVDYYDEASHYTTDAIESKKNIVASFIKAVTPSIVWDMGANTGLFSRIPAEQGIKTVAFDMDAGCVDANYRWVRSTGEENLLPLISDLANPNPGIGWANEERMSLEERGPADLVMALALIHHLAIGNNVPLPRIADYLAALGRQLIIEFIPKEDERVQELLATREDIFPDYTREGFERAFQERFHIERTEKIEGSGRVVYLMRSL